MDGSTSSSVGDVMDSIWFRSHGGTGLSPAQRATLAPALGPKGTGTRPGTM